MAGTDSVPIPLQTDAAGWLIVREDGVVVAADEQAMTLVGAGTIATLVGRSWPSLVAADDAPLLAMAVTAFEHGEAWSGVLSFQFDDERVPLSVSLVPRQPGRSNVAIIHLTPGPDEVMPAAAAAGNQPDERLDLEVLVDAIEAAVELKHPQAIARAVLQSIRPAIPFDWGLAFRLFHEDHFGTPPAAEVVATYPTGLAGIDTGAAWMPIDHAEQALLDAGEPLLDGRLARGGDETSPLRRLPAFGMRSRLVVPLFAPAGGGVNGAVALYSTRPVAFNAADGLRLERFVRRLGAFVGPAVEPIAFDSTEDRPPRPPATPTDSPQPDVEGNPAPSAPASNDLDRLADFAAGVAHELNNPLAAVLGYAQLLPQLGDEERAAALSAIESETLRASEVTSDLLSFARRQPAARREVNLSAVASRVLDVLQDDLERSNIEVTTNFASLPPVVGDEPQLEQAILHLLRNAIEAMPDGGTLSVATHAAAGAAQLEVRDSGRGVPSEIAGRIFEPFVTGHDDSTHRGMGLAIVHGVVGLHGGRVWFENMEPHGSRFVLELPLGAEPTA